jgi:hypothetical protein
VAVSLVGRPLAEEFIAQAAGALRVGATPARIGVLLAEAYLRGAREQQNVDLNRPSNWGRHSMAKNLRQGSRVRYEGDLPEGWDRDGIVVAVTDDASGDQIATVEFGDGKLQDIPVSELDRDPVSARYFDDDGIPID